jgi:hypothetical protein
LFLGEEKPAPAEQAPVFASEAVDEGELDVPDFLR